jgi:hypothetical protein
MTAPLPVGGAISLLFAVDVADTPPANRSDVPPPPPLPPLPPPLPPPAPLLANGGGAPPRADGERAAAPRDAAQTHSSGGGGDSRTLYTRESLASALCLMGAKPRHSTKVAARVFDALSALCRRTQLDAGGGARALPHRLPRPVVRTTTFAGAAASLPRPQFEALVAWALAEYQYAKPDQLEDLRLACRRVACAGRASSLHSRGSTLLTPQAPAQDSRAPDGGVCAAVRHERHRQVHAGGAPGALAGAWCLAVPAFVAR